MSKSHAFILTNSRKALPSPAAHGCICHCGTVDTSRYTNREEIAPIKDDLLVKLYAGHLVPCQTILAKLEAHRRQHQQRLTIYQEIKHQHFKNPQALSKTLKFQYMTLLRGIHYETGWLAWCDEIMLFLK
jgi:hypothetical protein